MMEHIRQFDWCSTSAPSQYFIDETALDNSNTEKIIQNKFVDPLLSSDEEEHTPNVVDWDAVFKTCPNNTPQISVPCLRAIPPYPKLSALTPKQHHQMLKVLCVRNPQILEAHFIHRPSSFDYNVFESLKPIYEEEQKEYIEWAKSLWINNHCARALRPKPAIEMVYEAEFKIRAQRLSGYPKMFDMAAQIPLECTRQFNYDATPIQTLVAISKSELPQIELPHPIQRNTTVIKGFTIPEPCHKHPYQFILPNESNVSILPITEIHRELALYAAMNGTKFIASENALKCLVELNRHWTIPVTVCEAYTPDGESVNVVVLDSEFSIHKEPAMTRTFRALKHLIENQFIPAAEVEKIIAKRKKKMEKESKKPRPTTSTWMQFDDSDLSSDEEMMVISEDRDAKIPEAKIPDVESLDVRNLHNEIYNDRGERTDESPDDKRLPSPIDIRDTKGVTVSSHQYEENIEQENKSPVHTSKVYYQDTDDSSSPKNKMAETDDMSMEAINDIIGVYSCTCTDTRYEVPPRRSYRKWRLKNVNTAENVELIVHCAHKARNDSTEVILEPIPEYQIDLGGSEQPPDRIRALTLSLFLRENTDLINVRLDASNGDIATIDALSRDQFLEAHTDKVQQVLNIMQTTLSELQGLLPGHYLLQHEPSHGANAFLHVSRPHGSSIKLDFDSSQLGEADEAKMVKIPPTLTPVLMPHHKYRMILPCAFTPFDGQLAKEQKKPPNKQRQPPQAIKWPKRKRGKKNK